MTYPWLNRDRDLPKGRTTFFANHLRVSKHGEVPVRWRRTWVKEKTAGAWAREARARNGVGRPPVEAWLQKNIREI